MIPVSTKYVVISGYCLVLQTITNYVRKWVVFTTFNFLFNFWIVLIGLMFTLHLLFGVMDRTGLKLVLAVDLKNKKSQ
jgi:hypothetical protein